MGDGDMSCVVVGGGEEGGGGGGGEGEGERKAWVNKGRWEKKKRNL